MSNKLQPNSNPLAETAKDAITSGNPIKIIGGIALATVVVAGMAIRTIGDIAKK